MQMMKIFFVGDYKSSKLHVIDFSERIGQVWLIFVIQALVALRTTPFLILRKWWQIYINFSLSWKHCLKYLVYFVIFWVTFLKIQPAIALKGLSTGKNFWIRFLASFGFFIQNEPFLLIVHFYTHFSNGAIYLLYNFQESSESALDIKLQIH